MKVDKVWEILQGIVQGADIADTNSGATTGDRVSMKNHEACIVLVTMGDGTAGKDLDFTVHQSKTVAGGSEKVLNCLDTGRIYRKSAADFTAVQLLTAWTKVTQATADEAYEPADSGEEVGMMAGIILAEDLDVDGGFDVIGAKLTDPDSAKYAVIHYILIGAKYPAAVELMPDPLVD